MNKEEFLKATENVPKTDSINSISAYNSINVEDLANAVNRFKKVPTYDELLKENKQLKDNWNKLKEFIKDKYVYYEKETLDFFYGYKVGILGIRDKMQEIEQGSDSNE